MLIERLDCCKRFSQNFEKSVTVEPSHWEKCVTAPTSPLHNSPASILSFTSNLT